MKRISIAIFCLAALSMAGAAQANSYSGTLRIVQDTPTSGTLRFLVTPPGTLSLFAKGDFKDVILQGFYRKAIMSISYAPTTCPLGISGTCGTVNGVTVSSVNF